MKTSKELLDESRQEENDYKSWNLFFKSKRMNRFELFMECLPIIKSQINVLERPNESFSFNIIGFGMVDLYPKSNKALIRHQNKWVTNGFEFIIKKAKLKIESKDI